ncbi:MAG TPA: MATE family efflux transporter [Gemmatimonadaceae bacterium]
MTRPGLPPTGPAEPAATPAPAAPAAAVTATPSLASARASTGVADTPARPAPPAAPERRRFDRSIVEGPLAPAVWRLAWPTMLTNIFGGVQAMVDHILVGHFVGFTGNAAIGVANQIWIVVIVFLMSVFTGMSVLVARFAGAGDEEKADRVVYQAFLTAAGLSLLVLAPIGYLAAPTLLRLVNAAPEVRAEALPYLRISMVFSAGMLVFFMTSGALRSAGDARTPMVMGVVLTVLNLAFNLVLIPGLGPVPRLGVTGAAIGSSLASMLFAAYAVWKLVRGGWVVSFPRGHGYAPDWGIIRSLFRFGLPTGIQGIAMNIGGLLMLAYIGSLAQSAAAQAAYAVSYGQLFSFVTWTSVGLLGAAAAVAGQNLGAGKPDRATAAVHVAARIAASGAAAFGLAFLFLPRQLLGIFGMHDPVVAGIGVQLLHVLSLSGLFIAVALTYTGGLQGTGDTKSPLYISVISQVIVPLGICTLIEEFGHLDPLDIWLAILAGHITRCTLSMVRFRQGKWRHIAVDIGR